MATPIFIFILAMWILIILGGGILVLTIAPISISGFGEFDMILSSGFKAIIAIILVMAWILILLKMKKGIFHKMLKF
ncbi:MAG: hypothetical protein OEM79_03870 [Nitrosopumilus sp.]|nr:hypothetical protein [Nitrosopumilus sp.]